MSVFAAAFVLSQPGNAMIAKGDYGLVSTCFCIHKSKGKGNEVIPTFVFSSEATFGEPTPGMLKGPSNVALTFQLHVIDLHFQSRIPSQYAVLLAQREHLFLVFEMFRAFG